LIASSITPADKKEETSLMVVDVLYIHPAKQKVGARYDKYVLSAPYLFMPGVPLV
jgi:hypothetical protein